MQIHVTKEHIAAGIRMDCASCPVAIAIRAVCLPSIQVSAHILLLLTGAGHTKTIDLPDDEWERICDFDAGRGMFPHSFDLDLPAWALRDEVDTAGPSA